MKATGKVVIGAVSVDAKALYDRLTQIPQGGEVSYADLSTLIGRNVQAGARGALNTARHMAQRENQIAFAPVRNEGLRRLTDEGVATQTGPETMGRIRRAARRGARRLVCVSDFNALPNAAKVAHNTAASVLGAVEHMTKPGQVKQVEKAVTKSMATLPLAKTLEAFKGE